MVLKGGLTATNKTKDDTARKRAQVGDFLWNHEVVALQSTYVFWLKATPLNFQCRLQSPQEPSARLWRPQVCKTPADANNGILNIQKIDVLKQYSLQQFNSSVATNSGGERRAEGRKRRNSVGHKKPSRNLFLIRNAGLLKGNICESNFSSLFIRACGAV